jgi:hypothetical protein
MTHEHIITWHSCLLWSLLQVHLHERFSHVFVDSSGGHVEAWISPAAALKLQVAADGGVALDPSLKVSYSRT